MELDRPVVEEDGMRVRDLLGRMVERGTGYALLTREGRLSGILTERDVVRRILPGEEALDRPARQVMTPDPVSVEEGAAVADVIRIMVRGGMRHVVVLTAEGEIVGCLGHAEAVAYLCDHVAPHVLNRPFDPQQAARRPDGA